MRESDLLQRAVDMVPDLSSAVKIARRVGDAKLPYPIASHDDLYAAFDGSDTVALDGVSFTRDQVARYFPRAFFPITSPEDLLPKVYAALVNGRAMHELEARLAAHARAVTLTGEKR